MREGGGERKEGGERWGGRERKGRTEGDPDATGTLGQNIIHSFTNKYTVYCLSQRYMYTNQSKARQMEALKEESQISMKKADPSSGIQTRDL